MGLTSYRGERKTYKEDPYFGKVSSNLYEILNVGDSQRS